MIPLRFMKSSFLFLLLLLVSCAGKQGSVEKPEEPLRLFLRVEQSQMRPGEALIAEAMLANISEESIEVTVLNDTSLTFWFWQEGVERGVEIEPAASEKEDQRVMIELAPDELHTRKFVFPQAGMTTGTFTLQASYERNPHGLPGSNIFASARPQIVTISGDQLYERDRDGLILKKEAIRIARRHFRAPGAAAEARMVINEGGFKDWLVIVGADQPVERQKALLVNPYVGGVRGEVAASRVPEERKRKVPPPIFKRKQ